MAAAPCLQWSPLHRSLNDVVLSPKTTWLGTMSTNLSRTRSFEFKTQQRSHYSIRRTCSASFDESFNAGDDEFSRKIDELALRFQLAAAETAATSPETASPEDWNPASIEMRANCVEIPISLRMIKQKKNQLKESLKVAGNSACCSARKAFSSMVFMIREVHSCSFQLREQLFYEDLQGVLVRVQREMHASFAWLFQQVFSHTPTLMVYIMILLANFTVHSMSSSTAFAAVVPPSATAETEISTTTTNNFDSIRSFYTTSPISGDKTSSVGGGNGGGNKYKPVASGMDGDGWTNDSPANISRPVVSDGVSKLATREEEESISGQDEVAAWEAILGEASEMQAEKSSSLLSEDVTKWFVSPVKAEIEADNDVEAYVKTELVYQTELAQEPNNVLLLANYAQFLYLVVHDFDRAEEYFKKAIKVEPKDAEAHNKYATFLWQARNDLWAAEETYLEAISADPTNSFYAANYAHFLWNTGGDDTCFPLDDDDNLDS